MAAFDHPALADVERGGLVALALVPGVGVAFAVPDRGAVSTETPEPEAVVASVEARLRPRWVVWSQATAGALVASDVRVATCWDLAAVHRLLFGGWRCDPALVWARLHELAFDELPRTGPLDLFTQAALGDADPDAAVRTDGFLHPDWAGGGWADAPQRWERWAELALEAAALQQARLAAGTHPVRAAATGRSESTAELLCAELANDGLPVDRAAAEALIAGFVGPRPRTASEAAEQSERRKREVLRHAPPGPDTDLGSPGQVMSLLRRIGVEVPDTRAWRLEERRDEHPLIDALLTWRKAERVATTYGYAWLDDQVGTDGRLRGTWTGCDGAAGRMTASAGLHNMPADLRSAVIAEAGHVFVRADLGQIEPRVLAAVSGDAALARATVPDDMYAPVATQLGVDRATAKVAVLGAMYGQTTGHGARALRGLHAAYPVAMRYLDDADRAAQAGTDLRTYGGRLVRMGSGSGAQLVAADPAARSRAAARGRYGRNAMVQGAAAELFKVWAVTVRARSAGLGAQIVLCLHDELLVHAPAEHGDEVAALLHGCLDEAAARWAPDRSVRFVAEVGVIRCWADAKA